MSINYQRVPIKRFTFLPEQVQKINIQSEVINRKK